MSAVIAAHVRKIDPPQFIAEDLEELEAKVGEEWGGEQCDNCGNSLYIIGRDYTFERRNHPRAFFVKCVPDHDMWQDAGQEIPEGVGCGTEYRLAWYREEEVQF